MANSLSTAALLAVWRLAQRMPPSLLSSIGARCGRVFAVMPSRERTIARLHVERILKSPESAELVRRMFEDLGRTVFEGFALRKLLQSSELRIDLTTPHDASRFGSAEGPHLMLSGHLGNWELLAAWLAQQGRPLVVIGKPARHQAAQTLLDQIRNEYGVQTIWRGDSGAIRSILQHLDQGHMIGGVIDQDTTVRSLHIPFFGIPAKTPSTLAELACKRQLRVSTVFLPRLSKLHFRMYSRDLDSSKGPEFLLRQFHEHQEEVIRAHPTQWSWFHKRWRTEPGAEPRRSADYISWLQSCSP